MRNPESGSCSVGGDTMKRKMDVLVKCPYYKGEEKQKIVCEGVQDGTAMHLAFDTQDNLRKYKNKFCKAFIRTIPLLQYDEHRPEDLDTDGEDHVADEVRYFCMSRPIKPRVAVQPDEYAHSPMAMFLDIPKEDIKAVSRRPRMEVINGD